MKPESEKLKRLGSIWGKNPYNKLTCQPGMTDGLLPRLCNALFTTVLTGIAHLDDLDFLQEQRVAVNTDEPLYQHSSSWTETNSMQSGSKLITFNQMKIGPLQDARLREAIHRLLDRRQLLEDLRGTRLFPSTGFRFNGTPSLTDSECDIHKGMELLQQSDYKGETLYLYVYERHAPDAFWIQQQLKSVPR